MHIAVKAKVNNYKNVSYQGSIMIRWEEGFGVSIKLRVNSLASYLSHYSIHSTQEIFLPGAWFLGSFKKFHSVLISRTNRWATSPAVRQYFVRRGPNEAELPSRIHVFLFLMLSLFSQFPVLEAIDRWDHVCHLYFLNTCFHFLSLKTKAGKAKRFSIQKYALIFIGSTSGDIPLRTAPLTREGLKSLIIRR